MNASGRVSRSAGPARWFSYLAGVFTASLIIALMLPAQPAIAETALPVMLQAALATVIDTAQADGGRCAAPPLLTSFIGEQPDLAGAVARYAAGAAGSLRDRGPVRSGESPCRCISALAMAIAAVRPEQATEIRAPFATEVPECSGALTLAMEESLARAAAAAGAPTWPQRGIFRLPAADEAAACGYACSAVEPGRRQMFGQTAF